ncbi:collagen-like protein [Lactiplantibacillus plantarum]|nr:collagen-like protein [Lactiplantibacillus plantarum]
MAKTLSFAYESPREVKVGDDETTFILICKNEDMDVDRVVDLTGSKSIIAKIGNRSGYLRGQLISLDSSPNLRDGKIRLTFEKSTLDNFPPGLYNLEIWVIDSNGTSIYPSDNPFSFTVTSNLESGSGKTITTVAFDDFVEAMKKAASTIAKGDKGDPGNYIPETFTNLAALQSKYPTGSNGIMVTADTGHKYIWANSTWTDAGIYQAVGIADGSVGWKQRTPIGSQTQVQYFGTGKINFDWQITSLIRTSPESFNGSLLMMYF